MSQRDDFDREFVRKCRDEFFDNPLGFVRIAFPWGDGELAEHPGPDEWQTQVLAEIGELVKAGASTGEALREAIASGHGIGKTALVAWIILWAMSTRPNLSGTITANTRTQLETKTWRELSVWHKRLINGHWFTWTTEKFYQTDHPETWFVSAIPWQERKSEAFAGLHGKHVLVIYDEASAVPDAIWEVSEGAMTQPGAMWFVFSNATRNTGRFRECFGRFRHRWHTRQIDSRSARMTNKTQIQQWVDDYGEDSDFVRVRVRGVFPRAGDSQFIPIDLVEEAIKRELAVDRGAALVMGVDVARFGGAKSVIRFRSGRDARSIKPLKFRGKDTMQIAGFVAEQADKHQPEAIFVDGNGVGGGVVDRLRSLGYNKVREVQFGGKARNDRDYHNKRAECYGLTRDWLPTGCMDDDLDLKADLTGVEYGFDNANRVQLEKKEDMEKRGLASPDDGDALALTFAEPVARVDSPLRIRAGQVADMEYPVFG